MPATSPPAARSVAAAFLPLVIAATVSWAVPSSALAARWLRPVPGEVARPFLYARAAPFAAGAHRGVDLAAAPGSAVRTACPGIVVHAGPVPGGGRAASVRCERLPSPGPAGGSPTAARSTAAPAAGGGWRVTYLPLARVAVAEGAVVRAGARLGTLAAGHGGLHLGVRREGDPFGYVDPLPFLAPRAAPLPPPVRSPRLPTLRSPRVQQVRSPRPRAWPAPWLAAPAPRRIAAPTPGGLATWPVWLGGALVASGAAGSGTLALRRRRRAAPSRAIAVAAAE